MIRTFVPVTLFEPPAEMPLAVYQVVVEDGRVLIEVPEGPLEVNR